MTPVLAEADLNIRIVAVKTADFKILQSGAPTMC